MKVVGKAVLLCVIMAFVIGCSMNGQVQSSNDTQWSSYYQAMHDRVQSNNPEMDHVLAFCNEMIRVASLYEQNAMTRQQFVAKQQEMRALLQQEDEFRRQSAWNHETESISPLEQYLASNRGTDKTVEGMTAVVPEKGQSDSAAVQ